MFSVAPIAPRLWWNDIYDVWKGTSPPWQMENDLGPLDMSKEVPQVSIEEAIEKMETLHQQVLEVTAGNIKMARAHQAKTHYAKHARNDFEVGAKVWKKNPLWNTKQKSLKKGPMWRGPYEVEGKTSAGNYLVSKARAKERLGTLLFLQIS